jgi:site-specific DNA-adenine methylase
MTNDDLHDLMAQYNTIVEQYQELHRRINELLDKYGRTEAMSEEEIAQYREYAQQRDDVFNQMRNLELQLFSDNQS